MFLTSNRWPWLLIAAGSAALALASILLTEWLALQPCHLCIFQRLLFMLMAPLALIAAFTTGWVRRISGALTALAAAGGAATAGFQTWLQAQPEGSVSCLGPDMGPIERFVEWLGMQQPSLFMATGFCEDVALVILGLSLAQWALLAFLLALGLSLWWLGGAPHTLGTLAKNPQPARSFVAFLVTWSFLLLTITGIVLYIVPSGQVAHWTLWSFAGLSKEGWADVHILFGAVFIVAGALHLYYNWKPFKKYLATRISGHLALKRELVTSLIVTVLLTLGALFALPPVSWLFDLNDAAKSMWAQDAEQRPPYARAEVTKLPVLAQRLGLDLEAMVAALEHAGIHIDDPKTNLKTLARVNDTSPAALFALIPRDSQEPTAGSAAAQQPLDPALIEDRFVGIGVGGKTLADFAEANGLDLKTANARLTASDVEADPDETLKAIAERYSTRPIEIAKIVLSPAYRLPSSPLNGENP